MDFFESQASLFYKIVLGQAGLQQKRESNCVWWSTPVLRKVERLDSRSSSAEFKVSLGLILLQNPT